MDTMLKDYVFKMVDKYVFVKKVYFNYVDERIYYDLLVYSQVYRSDIEYLAEHIDASRFDEVAEQTIKNYLKKVGVDYER